MKAQDYEKIIMLNQETEKVVCEKEVIWEGKWWSTAVNLANSKLSYEDYNNAYFYLNSIHFNKDKNQIYIRWNESALSSLNNLEPKIRSIGPAFYISKNGKSGDYIGGIREEIGKNTPIINIKNNNLIKVTTLNKTEVLVETYCKTNVQFNFWIYNNTLGRDINRINNILGLFIAIK